MKRGWTTLLLLLGMIHPLMSQPRSPLTYSQLPDLPALDGKPNPGLAGAFAGMSQGALLLAGGANFPDGYPWQNGKKVWHNAIYVLDQPEKTSAWRQVGTLPRPVAYGASVTWNDQLICLGGNDATQAYADVWLLSWDRAAGQVRTKNLPPLPVALANLSAAVVGNELYVFGGEANGEAVKTLYVLTVPTPEKGWQQHTNFPGAARAFTALVALEQPGSPVLVVLGGRQTSNRQTTVLADAYQCHIREKRWSRLADLPVAVAAHEATGTRAGQILVLGGDDGVRLRQIEQLNNKIASESSHPDVTKWIQQRNELQANHPGFRREVWQYQTVTKGWSVVDTLPYPTPVTTTLVRWQGSFILPSGEIAPGIRTPAIRVITPTEP
jgi:cyclically-permuted mutarotase family protein